jgi:hypothetical protein
VLEAGAVEHPTIVVVEIAAGGPAEAVRHPPEPGPIDVDDVFLVAALPHGVLALKHELLA